MESVGLDAVSDWEGAWTTQRSGGYTKDEKVFIEKSNFCYISDAGNIDEEADDRTGTSKTTTICFELKRALCPEVEGYCEACEAGVQYSDAQVRQSQRMLD